MASPNCLRAGSAAGPVDRRSDDAPDETGVGVTSEDSSVDEGCDPPDTYDDYTPDWRQDYGNAVGISSWREL